MENIEKALLEISRTLKEIRDIDRERLNLEKEDERSGREDMEHIKMFQDNISNSLEKGEQLQDDFMEMVGVKKPVDIDGVADQDDPETEK